MTKPYSTVARRERRYLHGMNQKGQWCNRIKGICQESYCAACYAFLEQTGKLEEGKK